MTKNIPNFFTLLNLLFGCLAIVYVMENGLMIQYSAEGTQVVAIPEKIWMGALFILLAAIVDFLDGFVARIFNATSGLGAQLDSLADVVSFGVAPSLILFQFLKLAYAGDEDGLNTSILVLLPAFLPAIAGCYRLARFNTSKQNEVEGFIGLPIPAAGLCIAALAPIYWFAAQGWVIDIVLNKWVLYAISFSISWLMISHIRLLDMKFKSLSLTHNKSRYLLIIVSIVLIIAFQFAAVPLILLAYIFTSILHYKILLK